jgi:hypothetical protein
MSNKIDLAFDAGENWKIIFVAHDSSGAIMALDSGVDVEFHLNDESGVKIAKSIGDGIYVTDGPAGVAEIGISIDEQIAAGIVESGVYEYAIRIVVGVEVSIQAEGTFSVGRDRFSGKVNLLLVNFRSRFPEFLESDAQISLAIKDASLVIDADDSWRAPDIPTAKLYLAAHLLQMGKNASASYDTGGQATGAIKSIKVEDRSVSFATPGGIMGGTSSKGLSLTLYGQHYLSMLRRNVIYTKAM